MRYNDLGHSSFKIPYGAIALLLVAVFAIGAIGISAAGDPLADGADNSAEKPCGCIDMEGVFEPIETGGTS